MRGSHFEALAPLCPACQTQHQRSSRLELAQALDDRTDIVRQGILCCPYPSCESEYPILDGIPFLVPNLRELVARDIGQIYARQDLSSEIESLLGDCCGPGSAFDIARQQLSSYAWDHWGGLDPKEGTTASSDDVTETEPGSILRLLDRALSMTEVDALPAGPVLDLGCSVGGTSFALSKHTGRWVLGVDLNISMLRLAADVLVEKRVRYPRRRIGLVYDRRTFEVDLPSADRVDFWACDGSYLPFRSNRFAAVIALNFLDSAHSPLQALRSIARVLRTGGRAVLACPYDWSVGATPLEAWIGGHSQRGRWQGSPDEVLRALVTPGSHPAAITGLRIVAESSDLPWRVRLHDRGRVEYRCHLLVIEKERDNDRQATDVGDEVVTG